MRVVERIKEMWDGVKDMAPTDNFTDFSKVGKGGQGIRGACSEGFNSDIVRYGL